MSKRITVVGAGFAALTAVRTLRANDRKVEITVVAPKAEMVYLPSLIWIPSGLRQPDDLRIPLAPLFQRLNVNFHAGEATGLSADGRTLATGESEVANDGLLIASGGRFIKKLPGIEHAITPCEGIEAAVAIRDRLQAMDGGTIAVGFATNPNEPAAMRGGPMFEFLFGTDTLLRRQGRREHFKLVFFSPATEPGKRLGDKAVRSLLAAMATRGIETHLGHKIKNFAPDKVVTEGGEIPADLILFMPGMTGNTWFDNTRLARSPGGMLKADRWCRVEGAERVYVAGDAGSFPGPGWMPKQAHMADLQAEAAGHNLLADLDGRSPQRTFKVELMCIVDSLDKGALVVRTEKRNLMVPPWSGLHWAKRAFERKYLRKYR